MGTVTALLNLTLLRWRDVFISFVSISCELHLSGELAKWRVTTASCVPCRALAAAVGAAPAFGAISAARAEDAQGVASSRMSYSRFLEYLDMGRVKKVLHATASIHRMGQTERQ